MNVSRVSFSPLFIVYISFNFGSAYDLQFRDAMNDLQEQVKVEHAPIEVNEHGIEVSLITKKKLENKMALFSLKLKIANTNSIFFQL